MKMKKLILLLMVAALAGCVNKPKPKPPADGIPPVVKEKFAAAWPKADSVKWEAGKGNYEADFLLNKLESSAVYDSAGNLIETETAIVADSLPAKVLTYFKDSLAGRKIREIVKVTDAAGKVTYEAEVDEPEYLFDAEGNLLEKVTEECGEK
jgi:predicted small lipoprotein YifL